MKKFQNENFYKFLSLFVIEYLFICNKLTEKIFLIFFDEIVYISRRGGYNMGVRSE